MSRPERSFLSKMGTKGRMKAISLAALMAVVVAACGGDDTTSTSEAATSSSSAATTEPSPAESTTTQTPTATEATTTTVTEVLATGSPLVIVAVDFDSGFILIRNDGPDDYDLAGHFVCNRPSYAPLPEAVLGPGESIQMETSLVGLAADSGELALYTSNAFADSNSIIRYVQWGSASHGRTSVAVSAGIWQDGDFVDNAGGSLESTGSDPVSAADWSGN